MKTRRVPGYLWLWCPGCDDTHVIETEGPHAWYWDGNPDAPTIHPSILVQGTQWSTEHPEFRKPRHRSAPGEPTVCHSFVRAGNWEFLADSTHPLAGQTVPLPELPDYLAEEPCP